MPKDPKRRKQLLVVLGILGAAAAFILVRGRGSAAVSASAGTDPSAAPGTDPTGAGDMPGSTFADNGSAAGALSDSIMGLTATNASILGQLSSLGDSLSTFQTSQPAPVAPPPDQPGPNPAATSAVATATTPTPGKSAPSSATRSPSSVSTRHLLGELRQPHSAAHIAHVKAELKSRGVKVPRKSTPGRASSGGGGGHSSGGRSASSPPPAPHNAPPPHTAHRTAHHKKKRR